MKSGTCVALLLAGVFFLSSCYRQDHHYSGAGNGNYNNNNGNTGSGGYPYVFDEEFNGGDHYGWTFTDAADSAYASITGGSYQYVDYSAVLSNLAVVNTGANTGGNFTVTARIKSNKVMGLIFGASGTDNGYAFFIDTAGNYSLYREGYGGAASTVIYHLHRIRPTRLKITGMCWRSTRSAIPGQALSMAPRCSVLLHPLWPGLSSGLKYCPALSAMPTI